MLRVSIVSTGAVSSETPGPRTFRLTETVGVLHPVDAMGSFGRGGVDIDIVEHDVGGVHHIDGPKLWLHNVEIAYVNITNVPKHKRHWTTWTSCTDSGALRLVSLIVVPDLAVTIDTTSAMAIDPNVVSSQNESSCVILEFDMIGIVTPIFEIFGEL